MRINSVFNQGERSALSEWLHYRDASYSKYDTNQLILLPRRDLETSCWIHQMDRQAHKENSVSLSKYVVSAIIFIFSLTGPVMKGPGIVSKHWPMLHKIMQEYTQLCESGAVKMSININTR